MRSGRGPAGAPTKTNHYDDPSSDSPAWIDENTGSATLSATRYVTGLDGNLVASVAHSGTTSATWQLVNLHGDVVTTCTDNTTLTTPDRPTLDADEYGNPRNTATARYGWLGGKQRSTDSLAGLTLMGVRLYSPVLGRFLQTDPEPGGSCNDYDYTCADPINAYDLDGKRCWFGRHRNGGCRGGRLARGTDRILSNPWVQASVTVAACSTGYGCAVAVWGFTAYNARKRYRRYGARSWRFWGGTALDVGLARIPIRRVAGHHLGRHVFHPLVRANYHQFNRMAMRRILRRNVVYGGLSVARSYAIPF